jgi:hypothetical protein
MLADPVMGEDLGIGECVERFFNAAAITSRDFAMSFLHLPPSEQLGRESGQGEPLSLFFS